MSTFYRDTGRQNGKTTAIINGVLNTPNAILVVANLEQKKLMEDRYPQMRKRVVVAEMLERKVRAGFDYPIVYDHFAVESIISRYNMLEEKHEALSSVARRQQERIEEVERQLLAVSKTVMKRSAEIVALETTIEKLTTTVLDRELTIADREDRLKNLWYELKKYAPYGHCLEFMGLGWQHGTPITQDESIKGLTTGDTIGEADNNPEGL